MQDSINIKGKSISVKSLLNVVLLAPKGELKVEDINSLIGFNTAVVSDKVDFIVYTAVEGQNIVLIKPEKLSGQETIKPGTKYAFISKMLLKKCDLPPVDLSISTQREPHRNTSYTNNRDNRGRGYSRNFA